MFHARKWFSTMINWFFGLFFQPKVEPKVPAAKDIKRSLTNSNDTKSKPRVKRVKPELMNPEYNFLCGVCLEYLVDPRMCKFCKYKSCEKCFDTWFKECNKDKQPPTCPQCRIEIKNDSLIHIPNLDELDRKFNLLQEKIKNIENSVHDVLLHFTDTVEAIESGNELHLTRFRNEVTTALDEIRGVHELVNNSKRSQTMLCFSGRKTETLSKSAGVKQNQKPGESNQSIAKRIAAAKRNVPVWRF